MSRLHSPDYMSFKDHTEEMNGSENTYNNAMTSSLRPLHFTAELHKFTRTVVMTEAILKRIEKMIVSVPSCKASYLSEKQVHSFHGFKVIDYNPMTFSRVPTAEFHKLTLKPAMVALSLKSKKKK